MKQLTVRFRIAAFRFCHLLPMSSAAAASGDTRVASGMMVALQCLMFLGFYFAVRHVERRRNC